MRDSTNPPPLPGAQSDPPPGTGVMRFTLDGVPASERPMVFREVFGREVIRYDIEPLPDVPMEADLTLRMMPRLLMMTGQAYGSRNARSREMVALDGSDDVGLIVNLRGPHLINHAGHDLVLGDGEATVMSIGEVCSYTHRPPGHILALRVPRAQFAPLIGGSIDDCYLRRIPPDAKGLKLLTNYVRSAVSDETASSPELQHLIVNHIYDLLAVVIGATRDAAETAQGRGIRAARLQAIKGDISRNLERGDLSVTMLADRHNCTPRFVQRLFETEGTTFTEYVLGQRLARAHRRLSDPRGDSEKISAVAYDCGFNDVSYFNRVFRRRFGASPSDIRAQARDGAEVV